MYGCNNAALFASALVDSGASHSFINRSVVNKLKVSLGVIALMSAD